MLKTSINFDALLELPSNKGVTDAEICEAFELIKASGLDCVDWTLGFSEYSYSNEWVEKFDNACKKFGIELGQTHTWVEIGTVIENGEVKYVMSEDDKKKLEFSIKSTRCCGCKNTVIHPLSLPDVWDDKYRLKCRQMNIEFFEYVLNFAHKYDVNICLETMAPHGENYAYCANPIELKDLHDVLSDEKIKYCVDTGHVFASGHDVADAIELLGDDIATLHLQDTYIGQDRHNLPPFGEIDWEEVCKALANIGYTGILNFEILGGKVVKLDRDAQLAYLKYCAEMGKYFNRLIDRHRK